MQIRLDRKRALPAALFAVVAFAAQLIAGIGEGTPLVLNLLYSAIMGAAAGAAIFVKIELKSWWSLFLGMGFAAFAGTFVMHHVLMIDYQMSKMAFLNNMCLSMVLLLLGMVIAAHPKGVCIFWIIVCYLFGMVDTAVAQFRGNVIVVSDVLNLGVALSVANDYSLQFMPRMISVLLGTIIAVTAIARAKVTWKQSGKLRFRALNLLVAALIALVPLKQVGSMSPSTWGRRVVYRKGILMELLVELNDLIIREPEGYSAETVESLAAQSGDSDVSTAAETEEKPHIIVIMDEAFSDLQAIGDFETDTELMTFFHELQQRSTYGFALSSVFGGNTANSEWEFLTGNSMAFTPSGSVVYRQYASEGMNSLVEVLENQGYQTKAMHCYHAGGWNRYLVYQQMGFDEMYFLSDLEWDETVRELVSDRAFVHQLIEQFESRDADQPLFFFGVTMQNHGGYTIEGYESTIHVQGLSKEYADVNQYLSLLQETDSALRELIEYFESVDEKVIIVLFGDHQPKVDTDFYDEVGISDDQSRFVVPWLIWKNYDDTSCEISLTSLNYLPAILLDEAELSMPDYHQFLLDSMEVIPAINSRGCIIDGKQLSLDDLEGDAAQVAQNYRILQYANMFDSEIDESIFVGAKN